MDFYKSHIYGIVTETLTSKTGNPLETELVETLFADLEGIRFDRHYGLTRPSGGREKNQFKRGTHIHNHRQWSAVSKEEMDAVAKSMSIKNLEATSIGANLLIEGIPDFSMLPSFTRLVIGKNDPVVLVVYEINKPCDLPMPYINAHEEAQNKFSVAAKNKRGLVGWVERAGEIQSGQQVEVWLPKTYPGIEKSQWM
jgi:MOSC domain-containing protein YiiM